MDPNQTLQPPEHPTVNDRQRLTNVVGYSIQLLFVITGFVGTKLEVPINTHLNKHTKVSYLVFRFIIGFHLIFVFSLLATIAQNPRNGTLF